MTDIKHLLEKLSDEDLDMLISLMNEMLKSEEEKESPSDQQEKSY